MSKTGLVWFTNNLRVEDNNALISAQKNNDRVIAVFCFDPKLFEKDRFGFRKTEKFRAQFLLETVSELKQQLAKLKITLLIYQEQPEEVLSSLVKTYKVDYIYAQKEWTFEERNVYDKVGLKLASLNVKLTEVYDQFLYDPSTVPFEIAYIPRVFSDFRRACEKKSTVLSVQEPVEMSIENALAHETTLPTLQDLGFESFSMDHRSAFPFKGGEIQAQQRLQEYFWQTKKLSYYKKTRNGLVGKDYSSKFSPWLANGSISAKSIYHQVKAYEKEVGKNDSTYWLLFELIWRDFFKYISMKHQNDIFKIGGILRKEYTWKTDETSIQNWIEGNTLEPFVNANMIELKETGWMSNRGRQNVASYFAKELQLDWRIGAAYFESMLIDYDVHSNYGNWMYVAGVGNDPRDRKFNIKLQAERYDKSQKFQNLWLQTSLF